MAVPLKKSKAWFIIIVIIGFGILLTGCGGEESSSPQESSSSQEVNAPTASEITTPEAEPPTATPVPTPTKTVKEHLVEGDDLLDHGDLEQAITEYNAAIELDPDSVDAYLARGYAYAELGSSEKALADFNRVLDREPDNATAYGNRGRVYNTLNKYDEALADLNHAIELNPKLAFAYNNRGITHLYRDEDREAAMADFEKAIELDPENARAYNNRGEMHRQQGNSEQALADYDQAIELDPDDPLAYRNRGLLHFNAGNYEPALADSNRVIELDPEDAQAYLRRGAINVNMGNSDQALADFSIAIELDPDYALAYYNRGVAHNGMGDREKALTDYSQAIEIDPTYAEAYNNRGHIYYQLEEYQAAITDYNQALELNPNRGEWYFNRAMAYGALEEWELAVADYNQASSIDSQVPQIYYRRGIAYANMGLAELAAADFEQTLALTNNPDLQEMAQARLKELGADTGGAAPAAGFTTFTSDTLGVSFQHPSDWAVMEDTSSFGSAILIAPDENLFEADTPFEQDVGVMVFVFQDLGKFDTTDVVAIQDEFMYNSFADNIEPISKISPLSIPGPEGEAIEGIAARYKGISMDDHETPVILDITTIIQGGRAGLFVAMMTEQAEAEYWPILKSILNSLDIQLTPPERVVNTLFIAARNQNLDLLADLCDPEGENDDDTQQICNLATDETDQSEFVQIFWKGRLNGMARFNSEGDMAEVPIRLDPDSSKEETVILINRNGQWYLYGF